MTLFRPPSLVATKTTGPDSRRVNALASGSFFIAASMRASWHRAGCRARPYSCLTMSTEISTTGVVPLLSSS